MSDSGNYVYAWVIRTKSKERRGLLGESTYGYFADRTSIKNPRFVTSIHYKVKVFPTKDLAETYYLAKTRARHNTKAFHVRRLKFFINKDDGYWDYWKNREVLNK
jgi:hypothetical protein